MLDQSPRDGRPTTPLSYWIIPNDLALFHRQANAWLEFTRWKTYNNTSYRVLSNDLAMFCDQEWTLPLESIEPGSKARRPSKGISTRVVFLVPQNLLKPSHIISNHLKPFNQQLANTPPLDLYKMASIRGTTYALFAFLAAQLSSAKDWDSPPYNYVYQFPLPSPPVKAPLK